MNVLLSLATPSGWCLENIAQLLHKCGLDISMEVLGSWALNGRLDKLTVLCYYLAKACAEHDHIDGSSMRYMYMCIH